MARYRKVDPRIWNDEKFRLLSDNAKLVFFFLLTHPHMTALGAMRASIPGLAAELGWIIEAFREAFGEALSKGMVKHDVKASFVWLPHFLRYNGPESPNVIKSWSASLDLLPECTQKHELLCAVKAFAEALPEAFAKSMPNQEQEQERESAKDKPSPASKKTKDTDLRVKQFIHFYHTEYLKRFSEKYIFTAKDGAQVKRLLQTYDLDRLRELAANFLDSEDRWVRENGGFTLGVFSSQINRIISTSKASQAQPKEMPL